MKKVFFVAALLGCFFIADNVQAQGRYYARHQKTRIVHGVKHGQLTPRETHRLMVQQRRIKAMKRVAKADGRVTPRERMIIRNAQSRASVAIYNQKHDRRYRW